MAKMKNEAATENGEWQNMENGENINKSASARK